jgi:hypothetical protein
MKKIDRLIQTIREMMVANAAGSQGGFGGSSESPTAGFDPVMKFSGRRKAIDYRKVPKTYRKWVNSLENK